MGGFFIFYNNYLGVNILETQVLNNLEILPNQKQIELIHFLAREKVMQFFYQRQKKSEQPLMKKP